MRPNLPNSKAKKSVEIDGQDTIVIKVRFESRRILSRFIPFLDKGKFGMGRVASKSCALARPYRQLFEEGKPIGKINYIFFKADKWPSHILGSLCFTPGHRLLFYPGLTERKVNWSYSRGRFQNIRSTGFVDHLTLENDFKSWHMTVLEPDGTKKDHLQSSKTKMINKNTIFWFGLSMQNTSVLETTPEELTLIFASPPRDSDRRVKMLLKARENAVFHLTTLNHFDFKKEEFLHFDFFVGPPDTNPMDLPCFVPMHEPIIHGYSQALKEGTPLRGHPVSLEGVSERIWVIASKHVGEVSDKAIFTIV